MSRQVSTKFLKIMKPVLILFEQQFLMKHWFVQAQHPLYSPDLAPFNIFLFPELKINHKGEIWWCGGHENKYDSASSHYI